MNLLSLLAMVFIQAAQNIQDKSLKVQENGENFITRNWSDSSHFVKFG